MHILSKEEGCKILPSIYGRKNSTFLTLLPSIHGRKNRICMRIILLPTICESIFPYIHSYSRLLRSPIHGRKIALSYKKHSHVYMVVKQRVIQNTPKYTWSYHKPVLFYSQLYMSVKKKTSKYFAFTPTLKVVNIYHEKEHMFLILSTLNSLIINYQREKES